MGEVADVLIELHKYPFSHLGSLDCPGERHVVPFARESLTHFAQSELRGIGCSSLDEYYVSSLRLILDLIVQQRDVLSHADDKGDYTLIDEDFHVTRIIDREWAHPASPAHAFDSVIGFLPVGDFYNGEDGPGDSEIVFARLLEEKGHQDLARFLWNGRVQHRFTFCCGYDLSDCGGFLGLFRGLGVG
ncbi:hypothetical protein LZ32DRAFT_628651 [Colletotrichum eremochloae]|nr:hypothetical protein LZ32DRAFT_628651 [Colletotrichum eremochloae]